MIIEQTRKPHWRALVVVVVLALATIACGKEASPTKVGEVPTSTVPSGEATQSVQPTAVQVATTARPESTVQAAPTNTAAAAMSQNYKVGDVIAIGDVTLVVLGWEVPAVSEFSKPDAGNRFVSVDVILVNKGKSTAHISSMMQMSLKDATGQKYTVDLSAAMAATGSSPDGEVAAGERIRGKVGFQVPETAGGLTFVFEPSLFGSGKVFVALGERPVAVNPPAAVAGETEQTTYRVGDVVRIGDLTLTVNGVSSPEGDEFTKPEADKKFVVVDLTIENGGAKSVALSSMLQMSLKDATGQIYGVDLMASTAAKGATPDGEVAAGEKVRGQAGYQVPTDARDLIFVFDADVWSAGKVFVQLQ